MRFHASGPRLYLFQMVLGVVVLDVIALAAYRYTSLPLAGPNTRLAFTVLWTVATAVVVWVGLRRIRRWRAGAPRA